MSLGITTVRYESFSRFTKPFDIGIRHLAVAFCDGSQETLNRLARERIVYRPRESEIGLSLTKKQRSFHLVVGTLETVGYVTIIIPFIISFVDKILFKPYYPKGGPSFQTHMEEGGAFPEDTIFTEENWRKNPFHKKGKDDPFYKGASWNKVTR